MTIFDFIGRQKIALMNRATNYTKGLTIERVPWIQNLDHLRQ